MAQAPAVRTGKVEIQDRMVRESQDKPHAKFPSSPTAVIPNWVLSPWQSSELKNYKSVRVGSEVKTSTVHKSSEPSIMINTKQST